MRENKYDTLKGILIFLVVFGHMLLTYDYLPKTNYNLLINCIYLFHMPLFFIISGYFSKRINKRKILDYIVLFLFMNTSFIMFDYFYYGRMGILNIKYASWFIFLLIIYRLIISNKKISNIILKKYSIIPIFIISILSGVVFKNIILVRLVSYFYFFVFGYRNKFNISKKYCISLLSISIALIGILLSLNIPFELLLCGSYNHLFEIIIRILIIITDTLLFISIIGLMNNKKVPIITSIGKNCLYIYVLHRIPTLIFGNILYPNKYYLIISFIISILICLVINILSKYIKKLFQIKILLPLSILFLIIPLILYNTKHELSINEQNKIDNSISIGFVGDLLLLENQLKLSNNDFSYMFNNTKEYFEKTDYVFGVLEGPVDDNAKYSYGNYDDKKELRLNYPTTFLKEIEKSGIDFVTISNNHIFDRGIDSYNNTINNLNNSKLDYISNNYKIINIKGIKVGVLAYTYGLNYLKNDDYENYLNFLTDPYSKDFNKVKNNIHKDFVKLKKNNVDLIIVMPHYGTEFSNKVDTYQEVWNRIFINEGANIILGDHSHAIEPIQYKKNSIIINSPGNYINSYIKHDGDISMYVKIYLDKKTNRIIASSITPIIATKDQTSKYYPKLLKDTTKTNQKRVLNIIESTIFNNKINDIKNTYYYLPNDSYKYDNKYKLELNNKDKNSLMYKKLSEHNKICFIGDSITEGTINGNKPWYLPLMSNFDKEIINISKESYTSYDILNNFSNKIKESNCDLSIINIGTNDIRYNKENVNNYINNIKKIIKLTNGEVIILAPWETTKKDYNIAKNDNYKRKLYNVYNKELQKIDNVYYINPNPYIKKVIEYNGENNYLLDGVHPNNNSGIELYSFATLR